MSAHAGTLAARALSEAGVGTVFALPGGHILHLLDGCRDAGLRVVSTRHEGAATLAAEGWALATGEVGVAAVTAGPGFANGLVGLLDAGVWSVPLVVLGGRTGLSRQGRGAVGDVDQRAIAAPATKATLAVTTPADVAGVVSRALYVARSGRPGPVYVDLPMDVLGTEVDDPGAVEVQPPIPPTRPDDESIDGALRLLRDAERPAVVAGSGAYWSGSGDELSRLCETAGLPITTTSAARGVIPDSHEWCLGTLVHGGGALVTADVVLVLGSAFNANLAFGREPLFRPDQTVIQVDVDPTALGGNRQPDLAVAGDVGFVARLLADRWESSADERRGWLRECREIVGHLRDSWDRQIEDVEGPGDGVHAGAAVRELVAFAREAVGDDVTFVADGGDALTWALAYTYSERPGRLMTTTTALGTLGVGLPFALAAKAARPDEPVFVFAGDGAFGLTAMELDTAVRHDLPIVCVVSNNAAWGDVTYEQDEWFGEGHRVASELAPVRYDRLAAALGGHGEHVTTLDELVPALERSLASGQTAVVNVETDPTVFSELLQNVGELGVM